MSAACLSWRAAYTVSQPFRHVLLTTPPPMTMPTSLSRFDKEFKITAFTGFFSHYLKDGALNQTHALLPLQTSGDDAECSRT